MRRWKLVSKYGLTEEQWDEMLQAQEGRCAICETDEPGGGNRRLSVDHDHATGLVRALLCNTCNRLVGAIERRPRVMEYLRSHRSLAWPEERNGSV